MKKIAKFLYISLLMICLAIFMSINAFAYLDPTVVTYAVQIGAGILIAGAAVFVVLWNRAKKKIAKKLNIDENKNKEVEEDVVILDDSSISEQSDEVSNNDSDDGDDGDDGDSGDDGDAEPAGE